MRFKIELENGDSCVGYLEDDEVEYLQERVKTMNEYQNKCKYKSDSEWNIVKEIVYGIIHYYIADHKNDR